MDGEIVPTVPMRRSSRVATSCKFNAMAILGLVFVLCCFNSTFPFPRSCLDSAFRCSYGGCIRSELECNGVQDCADGSDEKTINCPGVLNKIRANGNCE